MIDFRDVSRSYPGSPRPAVDGVSLHIQRGEFIVLIGASGSGKSTLLKMINRMERHDTGLLTFDGRDVNDFDVRALRLRMGYAIQSVGLFPHWSVARNIGVVPRMLGWPDDRIADRVAELLRLFDLDPAVYGTRMPRQLSGGQQQRVGVARALAADPDVLLMDEPFGALDPVVRAALQQEMKRIHAASGKTIVMVTHDIDEALQLASRIVLLDRGRVVQAAAPIDLLARPANAQVAQFLGRGEVGIRLLSLRTVASLMRPGQATGAGPVRADATLREAISHFAERGVAVADVVDSQGAVVGTLHAADIFGGAPA
jgi:osmoprotectant transport system ATP-binding protein